MCVILQARRGLPTGRADIGLQPCSENMLFLRSLRRDFEKVRMLLQLVVDREKLKLEQVSLCCDNFEIFKLQLIFHKNQ